MIELGFMRDRRVAVLGLGRTGLTAARALAAGGARVHAWDDDPETRAAASIEGIPIAGPDRDDWGQVDSLVLSPGIPHTHPAPHPLVARSRAAGAEIIGDTELWARAKSSARRIGVTGTNGKSTTTALIGHLLASAGKKVAVGGNLGRGVLDLEPLGRGAFYVVELSSYQLELVVSAIFDVAILINLSPDHLERHGGLEGYVAAKARIFRNQTAACAAVVDIDDDRSRDLRRSLDGRRRVIPISGERRAPGGVFALDGILHDDMDGADVAVTDLTSVTTLAGIHNHQNAAAAYAAVRAAGLTGNTIAQAIGSYPGLAHRQERVAVIDGIAYVNDSKATNPDSAARALACYRDIYWIAGGRPKDGELGLPRHLLDRVRHAFLIGEAEAKFAAALNGEVAVSRCGTLATAVAEARERATSQGPAGAVVLLSPACASFDQFRDFEDRGEAFRALVKAMKGVG